MPLQICREKKVTGIVVVVVEGEGGGGGGVAAI